MSSRNNAEKTREGMKKLANEVKDITADQLDPASLIRVAHLGYPVPAQQVSRALATYLWRRVLATQFAGVKNRIGEGENMFLIGRGLAQLEGLIAEGVKRPPCLAIDLLAWLPVTKFQPYDFPMRVSRGQAPRINVLLNFVERHHSFEVDDLSKYLEKDASGVLWTRVAYLRKTDWRIDTVEVQREKARAGTWYGVGWHRYQYTFDI